MSSPEKPNIGEKRRVRRAALDGSVATVMAGEKLDLSGHDSEDARKIERNAIAAVLIDRIISNAFKGHTLRPRFGLNLDRTDPDSAVAVHFLDTAHGVGPKAMNPRFINLQLAEAFITGLQKDTSDEMQKTSDPVIARFAQLQDKYSPAVFIQRGITTAIDVIMSMIDDGRDAYAMAHPEAPHPTELELTGIVLRSREALYTLAGEHLDVVSTITKELHNDTTSFVLQGEGDESFLAINPVMRKHVRDRKAEMLKNPEKFKTVATGCPALVRLKKNPGDKTPNAIDRLLDWYVETYLAITTRTEPAPTDLD